VDAAGYDPASAIALFEKLESLERTKPGAVSRMFLTHPPTGVRLQKVQQTIHETLPSRSEYLVTTSTYSAIRARLFAAAPETRDSH